MFHHDQLHSVSIPLTACHRACHYKLPEEWGPWHAGYFFQMLELRKVKCCLGEVPGKENVLQQVWKEERKTWHKAKNG